MPAKSRLVHPDELIDIRLGAYYGVLCEDEKFKCELAELFRQADQYPHFR